MHPCSCTDSIEERTRHARGHPLSRSQATPADYRPKNAKSRLSNVWVRRDLPAEIWTLVAHYCAARDLPNLAATCTMLNDVARHRARRDALAAYSSVDAFVTRWEKATAFCDRHLYRARCNQCPWGNHGRPVFFACALCVYIIFSV